MTIETLKSILKSYNLNANKTYGQHFLMDETVLEDMIDAAEVTKEDVVLEIGPGIGNLTERLLPRAKKVFSVEKDPQFLPVLKSLETKFDNFQYELTDILSFNFNEKLKKHGKYKVVANIPYYITGKIIQLFVRAKFKPQSLTLLVQKQVAQNIVAEPGDLALLGISVQLFGTAKVVQVVPAHKFHPAPKVDSAVIHVELPEKPLFENYDEQKLFKVLKACFAGKRKQLHNTLVNNLLLDKELVEKTLAQLKIDPKIRPQQLTIKEWLALTKLINP